MEPDTILLDRYQIREEISHKAGRRTFLARDLQNQQPVILKILEFNQFFQWEDLKLFEREVQTLQNLDHPAIPKYLDSFEIQLENARGFALVQTYIDAPSLETVIQEGRKFSDTEIKEIAQRLLEILIYLHEQNPPVIHRDIKPSNILLTNRSGNSVGEIYLVDFGSVQTVVSKESGTITIVGTYGYIPLEQFSGKTVPASDLFSLGMTLIYLITGVHPADLPQENGQVKIENVHLDRPFSRWLEKMTHPYLEKRYSSARLAIESLENENNSDGNYLDLRPSNSQIKLHREGDILQIKFIENNIVDGFLDSPFVSFGFCLIVFCFFLFKINFNIDMTFMTLLGPVTWMILISTQALCSLPVLRTVLKKIFKTVRYQVIFLEKGKELRIGYSYNLSENIHWKTFVPSQDIKLLFFNSGYTFDRFWDSTGKTINRGTVTIPPTLNFYLDSGQGKVIEYPIGNPQLSQAEYWWLAKEISDFLDVEITIVYPTPKVPPEASCGC